MAPFLAVSDLYVAEERFEVQQESLQAISQNSIFLKCKKNQKKSLYYVLLRLKPRLA